MHIRPSVKYHLLAILVFASATHGLAQVDMSKYYKIVAKNSNKCLTVRGGPSATQDGVLIQQSGYNGTDNQKWRFRNTTPGYYKIAAENSNCCLDVRGGNSATANGVQVQQYHYLGGSNQQWKLIPVGNGYYELQAKHSGKCLDVTGGPSARQDGIPIQQWGYNGTDNQKWQILPLNETVALVRHKKFPITFVREDNFGAFHMRTEGKVSKNGDFVARTETKNHVALLGHCGYVSAWLLDKDGNILDRKGGQGSYQFCVDGTRTFWGKSDRFDEWSFNIPPETLRKVASIAIMHGIGQKDTWDLIQGNINRAKQVASSLKAQ